MEAYLQIETVREGREEQIQGTTAAHLKKYFKVWEVEGHNTKPRPPQGGLDKVTCNSDFAESAKKSP